MWYTHQTLTSDYSDLYFHNHIHVIVQDRISRYGYINQTVFNLEVDTIRATSQPLINGVLPKIGDDTVIYAIGDIHGRLDLLQKLYGYIELDAKELGFSHCHIVHLGDYIDRGPQAREVIDLFCEQPMENFRNHWLIGNHEYDMLHFLKGNSTSSRWLKNGGLETLYSYGLSLENTVLGADRYHQLKKDLWAALPPKHLDFLDNLIMTYESGDYLFVHAGIRPGTPLGEQTDIDRLWIRDLFLDSALDYGKIIVHGHSPYSLPEIRPNRIGIDTGACYVGCLTCLVLQGTEHRFLQAQNS